jgi:hypothetical protein
MNIPFKPYNYTLNGHILRSKDLPFMSTSRGCVNFNLVCIQFTFSLPLFIMNFLGFYYEIKNNYFDKNSIAFVGFYHCCFHNVFTSMKVSLLSF